jgi:hypothetical protein
MRWCGQGRDRKDVSNTLAVGLRGCQLLNRLVAERQVCCQLGVGAEGWVLMRV